MPHHDAVLMSIEGTTCQRPSVVPLIDKTRRHLGDVGAANGAGRCEVRAPGDQAANFNNALELLTQANALRPRPTRPASGLAASWDEVPHRWWGPLAVWKGGLGIWGGIAFGTLAGIWRLRRAAADVPRFLDAAAPGLLVAQSIGRVGNWFNQELFGRPTASRGASRSTRRTARPASPTSRPSSTRSSGTCRSPRRSCGSDTGAASARPGCSLYLAGYSAFRIFEELLRVDPAHHILGLRLNFFLACGLTLAGATWFVRTQRTSRSAAADGKRRRA